MPLFLATLLLFAPLARAQDEASEQPTAKELALKGMQLYEQARYEESVEMMQQAYALDPRPGLLYNMSSPLERLGRWSEALEALKGYRPNARPEEIDAIDRRISAMELKVAQQRADQEALTNAQQQAAATVKKGPPAGAWVLMGIGAGGLGSGTVFTLRTLGARSDWKGQCVGEASTICPVEALDAVQRDKTSSVIADVSWVVGAVSTGAGVVIALGSKKKTAADLASVSLSIAPQSVQLAGRF